MWSSAKMTHVLTKCEQSPEHQIRGCDPGLSNEELGLDPRFPPRARQNQWGVGEHRSRGSDGRVQGRGYQGVHRTAESHADGPAGSKCPTKILRNQILQWNHLSKTEKQKILLNGNRALVVQTGGKIRKPYEMTQRPYLIHISCLERDCLLEQSL